MLSQDDPDLVSTSFLEDCDKVSREDIFIDYTEDIKITKTDEELKIVSQTDATSQTCPILPLESPKISNSLHRKDELPLHHVNPVESWLFLLANIEDNEPPILMESKPIPDRKNSSVLINPRMIQERILGIEKRAHAVSSVFAALCR